MHHYTNFTDKETKVQNLSSSPKTVYYSIQEMKLFFKARNKCL